MEILSVEYKNIYGCLSGNLKFKRGENFLVGINGCGKTTVLNLINWVLVPCLPELCTLEHELIKVDIQHGKFRYSINSKIMKEKHQLNVITKDKSRDFKPINTVLALEPRLIRGGGHLEDLKFRYAHLRPEKHEVSTWSFLIEELPTPVFIGLERSVEDFSSDRKVQRGQRYSKGAESAGAIRAATTLMRDAFNTSRRRLVEIHDELNCKVLELSFSGILDRNFLKSRTYSAVNMSQKIGQLKDKFASSGGTFSKVLSEKGVRDAVLKYLDELDSILKADSRDDKVWVILNQHNFKRASEMLNLFQAHESKAMSVQLEINNFVKAVNMFIGDSGKCITFDEDTGVPYFTVATGAEKLGLAQLSSGEAQVVILLSYFAFLAKKGIPIIIDEPELSLHVKWQKDFVAAVKQLLPQECQTIMATHSPEICGADEVNVQAISVRGAK